MPKVLLLTVLLLRWPLLAQPDCTRPSNVVRLDPSNKRLFAVGTDDQISTSGRARTFLKPIADYVSTCQSNWIGDWKVSIFTEPRFAVYKTELDNQDSGDPRPWAHSYIGEYNSRGQRLVIHPLFPQKKKWLQIAKIEK